MSTVAILLDSLRMKITALARTVALIGTAAGLAVSLPAHSQTWPSKPIRIVVPYSAGAAVDILTRTIVERLASHLGAPVIVENREGAGGVIGTQAVLRAPADGYTMLAIPPALLIAPLLSKVMPFDPVRDFIPVAKAASVPFVVVVSGQSQLKTMRDLLDYVKANPRKVNYATQGKGTQGHLEIEYFTRQFGLAAVDVPYKNNGAAVADTISNTVTFHMLAYSVVSSNVSAGKLRALAIGMPSRLPTAPDIPTFIEAIGIAKYAPKTSVGYAVVAGTPADIVSKLEDGVLRTMAEPAIGEQIAKAFYSLDVMNGREFGAEMKVEFEKFGKLIRELNLRTD